MLEWQRYSHCEYIYIYFLSNSLEFVSSCCLLNALSEAFVAVKNIFDGLHVTSGGHVGVQELNSYWQ